jgi:hypothetical protein
MALNQAAQLLDRALRVQLGRPARFSERVERQLNAPGLASKPCQLGAEPEASGRAFCKALVAELPHLAEPLGRRPRLIPRELLGLGHVGVEGR